MSVLEIPRIYFKGDFAWDPIVTNNTPDFYDEDTAETVFTHALDKVKKFRGDAIAAVVTGGNWNPQGTHRSVLYKAAISGVDLGGGLDTADPFVKAAANFTGMLVDLEPYGGYTSQLFFDTMHFGIDGSYRIVGKRTSRVTARYINFSRNPNNAIAAGVASVTWQTSFAKSDGLRVDAFNSPALRALEAALKQDDVQGLTVRMNAYRTIYYEDPTLKSGTPEYTAHAKVLTAKLMAGGFQPNPARSVMVGTIGLWRKGEPAHEPGDRALLPPDVPPPMMPLGSAHARLHNTTLTLDFSNTIREIDQELTKVDLGTLSLVALDPAGGAPAPLAAIPYAQYDRKAYDATSGIVTLKLTAEQAGIAADRDLQLCDSKGKMLLSETALRAIPSSPNIYLDQGGSANPTFQVYKRGVPATGPLAVTVYQMSADGGTVLGSTAMQTNAAGELTVPVAGTAGGIVAYLPSPAGVTPPSQIFGINPLINTYMYVRTLPADADIAALPPTWDNVYVHVLANWNAMAPCMDNWLMLNDQVQVKRYAATIKRLVDPANFESFLFMPVTRDMTAGERTLLLNFLNAPEGAEAVKLAAVAEPVVLGRPNRSLRS